jgi:putative Holliday junction resolvase
MSFLGLDFGQKRIGVAQSDELNLMAHAVGFIEHRNEEYVVREIQKLIDEHRIQKIVIGLPKTLKGQTGTQAQKVLLFSDRLGSRISCPIVTWDERLTTVQAERALIDQDVSRAKRREKRDAIAAEIMLQSYLDFIRLR